MRLGQPDRAELLARNTVGLLLRRGPPGDRGNQFQNGWAARLMATPSITLPSQPLRGTPSTWPPRQASSPSTAENYWDAYAGYTLDPTAGDAVPPGAAFPALAEQNS
jgi:hypothetical protein